MKLTDVLAGCGAEQVSGGRSSMEVTGVTQDSRRVKAGDLFVAVPGTKEDGAQYIGEAVSRGAVAVVAWPRSALAPPATLAEGTPAGTRR